MLDWIKALPRAEPLVLIGLLGSIVAVLQDNIANGHVDWGTAVPLIVGLVLRNFVTSPTTAAQLRADATTSTSGTPASTPADEQLGDDPAVGH